MDRRAFLEKFAKISGVTIAAGVCVSCTTPAPPPPPDELFIAISYERLDGIFVYLFGVELSGDFSDDVGEGVPVNSKVFRFHINRDVDIIDDTDKVKKYLRAFYINKNKKEYVPIEIKYVSDKAIEVEFKDKLLYHKEYYLEANPKIIKKSKYNIHHFKGGFHTTSLVLSSEKLTIVQGDVKTVNIKEAFYESKSFSNFDKIEIVPTKRYEDYKDIVKTEIDGNNIIIEAVKNRGDILFNVEATLNYEKTKLVFTNQLYIKIKP